MIAAIKFEFDGKLETFKEVYDLIDPLSIDLDIANYYDGTTAIIEFVIDDGEFEQFKNKVENVSKKIGLPLTPVENWIGQ